MSKLHDKFYYNIIIPGNPKDGEFESDAKFETILNQDLLNIASDFKMMVQKFRIDSERIPFFHVDLKQPQPAVTNNTNFITNYVVSAVINGVLYSHNVLWSNPSYIPARIAMTNQNTGDIYYDNRSPCFAVFSYQKFLDSVNYAIMQCFSDASVSSPPFLKYDTTTEKIKFYTPIVTRLFTVYFSINLFNYVGEGFRYTFHYKKPTLITTDVFTIDVIDSIDNVTTDYIIMTQEYKAISSWASINRILFVSNKLPINREFFPVANSNGVISNNASSYSNLVTMNILVSFLVSSTSAGDYRTNITFSSQDVDNSDLVDLVSNGGIREIDIEVFWCDKYGNVFPVRLGRNKEIDLRLVFVRK